MTDVIDTLVGIAPGSKLDAIRAQRSEARKHAQASYASLFEPKDQGSVTADERHAIAAFVAGLHGEPKTSAFYAAKPPAALGAAVAAEVAAARSKGPYGHFPKGPLSSEDAPGPTWKVSEAGRKALGARLSAAFEHTHMLVFHPRDASAPSLQALLDAGWSTTDVVTVSQLVSFLAYQIRVVAGLSTLASTL
ncbi:MAG: CMD domain protein [Reyranella sp.]|uniref:CMD domain protein n=1 Tax=Reyranella sp. TaxID=1929291 RepID=UPI0025FC78C8|nr:CMD domain protein [Reyranella sp.]MBR2813332.1 CMD domain protein [Reyranella sp.]